MALSIKNDAVETMIRLLAKKRRVTLTEAVRQALAAELAEERRVAQAKTARKRAVLAAVVVEAKSLPRLNDLTDDEILGYDASGLPK
jgi:antitoxin VapB